jgi:hypothetical protein
MQWLFLVHQVQTPNSRERVKVWRLTKKVGALLYRNSVYVLPYSKERLEDFHWLCQEIRDARGEASVFVAEARDEKEDRLLRNLFLSSSKKSYTHLSAQAEQLSEKIAQIRSLATPTIAQFKSYERELRQLDEAFREARHTDYFHHPDSDRLESLLRDTRAVLGNLQPKNDGQSPIPHHLRSEFQRKVWATRSHIHIDRLCSAWLIRRFIDPKARFVFKPEVSLPKNAILFDVFGVEFGHQGDRCTFETLLEAFRIKDPALHSLAELVHDIDLKEHKYDRPESAGLDMIVRSISETAGNDARTLELGSRILDALYTKLSIQAGQG